nr:MULTISPECIES: hypothetical protein [unclassified Brevundimonas]
MAAAWVGVISPASIALSRMRAAGRPRPSLDQDSPALVPGRKGDPARLGLARRPALLRRFQPMIGGVADHVGQGVADQLHDLTIQLGVLAGHDQVDTLAQVRGQVAHQSRQLGPGPADRLHPGGHHPFLQFAGHLVQAMQRPGEGGLGLVAQGLDQLIADQHQLADHGHQAFQRLDADADGLGALGRFGAVGAGGFGLALDGRGEKRVDRLAIRFQIDQVLTHGLNEGGFMRRQGLAEGLGQSTLQGAGRRRGPGHAAQGLAPFRLHPVEVDAGEEGADVGGRDQNRQRAFAGGVQRGLAAHPVQRGARRGGRKRRRGAVARMDTVQPRDQGAVVAFGFDAGVRQPLDHGADHVHRVEDDGDRRRVHRQRPVAIEAQHVLGGMGHGLQPHQAKEARPALQAVDQAEDVRQQVRVVRRLLEADQLGVHRLDPLAGLGDEFVDDVVHGRSPHPERPSRRPPCTQP